MDLSGTGDTEDFRIKMILVTVRDKDKKRFVFVKFRDLSLIVIKQAATVRKFCKEAAVSDICYIHFKVLLLFFLLFPVFFPFPGAESPADLDDQKNDIKDKSSCQKTQSRVFPVGKSLEYRKRFLEKSI